MPIITADDLTNYVSRLFIAARVPDEDAEIVARSLVGANLRGHDSHGVMRVAQYLEFVAKGEYQAGVDLVIESETPAVVVADGQWGFGQVQAHRLLDRILPKARALGIAAGTGRRFGHTGRLGEYAERAAAEGLVLMTTVNNDGCGQRVAPPGGTAGRLGTNPLCVGVPTIADPVVLDFGTSVVAEGTVRVHYISNKPVPEGWLIDHEGRPTTDPKVLYEPPLGGIRPMGGDQAYKGFGLSLILDLLCGGLSGGHMCHDGAAAAKGNNLVFVAFDPALFAGRDAMVNQATTLAEYIRATPKAPGVEAILLPGDPERRVLAERERLGIPLEEAHWQRLAAIGEASGVPMPSLT